MKTVHTFALILSWITLSIHPVYAVDDITSLVEAEWKKMQDTVKNDLTQSKRRLDDLKTRRAKFIEESQKTVQAEKEGVEFFRNYIVLLTTRYVNAQGDYQSGLEISSKDEEYINRIFDKYLQTQPLEGRVSAGHATRLLNWGIARLEELSKTHSQPLENNSSELEIIAQQTRDVEFQIKRLTDLVLKLGIKETEVTEPERKVASE